MHVLAVHQEVRSQFGSQFLRYGWKLWLKGTQRNMQYGLTQAVDPIVLDRVSTDMRILAGYRLRKDCMPATELEINPWRGKKILLG